MAKSFYDVLGVTPAATPEQIRQSYMLLNKMLHPDKFDQGRQRKEWQKANDMLKELNEAYAVLRNPSARAEYDQSLATGTAGPAPETPAAGSIPTPAARPLRAAVIARNMTIVVGILCLLVLPQTCTRETTVIHPEKLYDTYERRNVTAWGEVFVWTVMWCAGTYVIFRGSKSVYE